MSDIEEIVAAARKVCAPEPVDLDGSEVCIVPVADIIALYEAVEGAPGSDEPSRSGWQPIETAPKDGTRIWVYGNGVHDVASWSDGKDHEPDELGIADDGWDAGWVSYHGWFFPGASFGPEEHQRDGTQPTHWMPLPPTPEGEA